MQNSLAIRKKTEFDTLAEYRQRIMYLLGISTVILVVPVGISNIMDGELVTGSELIEGRQVTISVGISELGQNITADEWLKRADNAVYASKESGRNRVVHWRQAAIKPNESRKDNPAISKTKTALAS